VKPSRLICAVAGAAASAATLALALPAQAALATGWHIVFTQHYGAAANDSGYTAAVAVNPKDAWVFGSTSVAGVPAPGTPVAVQWNGTGWQSSSLPSGLTSDIDAASAISANDIWAVTEAGGDILHWDGTQWSVAKHVTGQEGAVFTGIAAFTDSDVWVFGASGAGPGLGTWHFDGTTWTHVTGRADRVGTVSALSPTDIWAIGSTAQGPAGNEIVHYNGSAWQPVSAAALKGLDCEDILALSDTNVWATAVVDGNTTKPVLAHLSNGVWSTVKLPWQLGNLGWLAPDRHGGFWLDASRSSSETWIAHRTAAGTWSRAHTPGFMGPVALIPGTTSLWGAGWSSTTAGTGSDAEIWAHGPAAASRG
jgi:hypothetical protein